MLHSDGSCCNPQHCLHPLVIVAPLTSHSSISLNLKYVMSDSELLNLNTPELSRIYNVRNPFWPSTFPRISHLHSDDNDTGVWSTHFPNAFSQGLETFQQKLRVPAYECVDGRILLKIGLGGRL
jgi:hypothetical protein